MGSRFQESTCLETALQDNFPAMLVSYLSTSKKLLSLVHSSFLLLYRRILLTFNSAHYFLYTLTVIVSFGIVPLLVRKKTTKNLKFVILHNRSFFIKRTLPPFVTLLSLLKEEAVSYLDTIGSQKDL